MVSIFRKNDVVNFLLLLPYTVLLRLYSLINPRTYEITPEDTAISKWFFSLIDFPLLQSIIGILVVFGQALLINVLSNNHRLHRLPTALAGMVYIVLVSSLKELQVLSPALIGLSFILLAILNVFTTYKKSKASPNIFNASFLCALAALFYPPYALFAVAMFIGFAMLRNFKWKERIQFLFGFLVLFWIIGAFFYFIDILDFTFYENVSMNGAITSFWSGDNSLWYSASIFLLLIGISLINYYNYMKKKVIDIRKKIDFFYWLLLCSVLSLLVFHTIDHQHYLIVVISLSVFISMSLLLIRNTALAELLHLIAVLGVFYLHFS